MSEQSSSSPAPRPARRRFVTTRWSQVLAAGRDTTPQARKALSELCQLYWAPLFAFFCHPGRPTEEARDLTQGFFAQLLESNALAVVDPQKGRFRTWLQASARNYLANTGDHARAQKRGGDRIHIELDEAERESSQALALGRTPEQAFERRWAASLLANARKALGEEYQRRGKGLIFEKLKGSLTDEEGDSHARIAEELHKTADAVKAEAFRLRRRYLELIRAQVADISRPEDIDEELRFLLSVFEAP
jgi:DNA-directed RNA polymerase specialized sigma24 family protein